MTTVIKFISTIKSKLDSLELLNGQLIFVEDTQELFLDLHDKRTQYGSFIFLNTEEQRLLLYSPFNAFYFVLETSILWRYEPDGWVQITSPPREQVVFLDRENFPTIGDASCIYISETDMYRWKDGEYQVIGSSYWKYL